MEEGRSALGELDTVSSLPTKIIAAMEEGRSALGESETNVTMPAVQIAAMEEGRSALGEPAGDPGSGPPFPGRNGGGPIGPRRVLVGRAHPRPLGAAMEEGRSALGEGHTGTL